MPEIYEKWNPERLVNNWHTPHLIVHNAKDYRLSEAEGLSAFTALQIKGIPSRFLSFPSENVRLLFSVSHVEMSTLILLLQFSIGSSNRRS